MDIDSPFVIEFLSPRTYWGDGNNMVAVGGGANCNISIETVTKVIHD